jgi:hypothetical protein
LSGTVASNNIRSGNLLFTNLGTTIWQGGGVINRTDQATGNYSAGSVTLPGVLDRIRCTMANGTDTFRAGNIGLLYET